MLDPEYLLHISEGAEDIAEQLHTDIINRIIERIMIRLGRGENYILTATDKWNIQVLQDAGYLLEDIQRDIAIRTKLQMEEIKEAMEEAGVKALDYDNRIYEAAGLSPKTLKKSPNLIRLMERNYKATLGEWKNFTRTTANAAQQTFLKAVDKAYTLTASGAVSYTQAVSEAIEEVASEGVVVKYPSGRTDTIEAATLRAVRTGIAQSTGEITLARMEEMAWDIILTSAHVGARSGDGGQNPSNHLWWQGQFFSRTGKNKQFPDFYSSTAYGTVEGLCGANCRHSFGPGDGVNNPFALDNILYADNAKAEQIQQRQRTLERRIRTTKKEVMALKTAIDNAQDDKLKSELEKRYERKAALLKKQNEAYNDFCKQNGLKRLSDRLQVARWDRQQASAASGAAKRYESKLDISNRQSVIKERVSNGEYSLKLSKQQYLKHVDGTSQFKDYSNSRMAKGQGPQSRITISESEIQEIITSKSGTGSPRTKGDGTVLNVEFINADKIIGEYFFDGQWIETKRAAIHYGKSSSHIVPVEDKNG